MVKRRWDGHSCCMCFCLLMAIMVWKWKWDTYKEVRGRAADACRLTVQSKRLANVNKYWIFVFVVRLFAIIFSLCIQWLFAPFPPWSGKMKALPETPLSTFTAPSCTKHPLKTANICSLIALKVVKVNLTWRVFFPFRFNRILSNSQKENIFYLCAPAARHKVKDELL